MNPQKTEEREGERKFEHDILELDVAIRREKRAERREMERIQFNYGIDLFWSSKSFFFLALSATCRGDVRQKRASVAYNERGTPFLFLFFPLCLSLSPSFFLYQHRQYSRWQGGKNASRKNANGRSTRVPAWNRLLTFLCRPIHVTFRSPSSSS